jgi:hypothetical protein
MRRDVVEAQDINSFGLRQPAQVPFRAQNRSNCECSFSPRPKYAETQMACEAPAILLSGHQYVMLGIEEGKGLRRESKQHQPFSHSPGTARISHCSRIAGP